MLCNYDYKLSTFKERITCKCIYIHSQLDVGLTGSPSLFQPTRTAGPYHSDLQTLPGQYCEKTTRDCL